MGTDPSLAGARTIKASSSVARGRRNHPIGLFSEQRIRLRAHGSAGGETVEVGLIGNEGFVGVPILFGFKTSPLRIMIQSDATAYRVDAESLRKTLPNCPVFEKQLQRFTMILGMQSTQLAACNRLHDVAERLARWLLMSHDRIGGDTMPLTQEFLGQMLGTRRSSVSMAASILQKAGMITYTRGSVTIVDKRKLAKAACDCYEVIQNLRSNWQAETK